MKAKTFRLVGILALIFLWLAGLSVSARAQSVQNKYTYPDYNAASQGNVDIMRYVQNATVTVNGQEYSQSQLLEKKNAGSPVSISVGQEVQFNFQFALCGRAYSADDPTQLDEGASTHTVYANGTTYLNGDTVAAGTDAILDDSSLMVKNSSADNSFLRMNIRWLLDLCAEDTNISYSGSGIAFVQKGDYLYFYFPNGIGNDVYANPGRFSIRATMSKEAEFILIPGEEGFYTPGTSDRRFELPIKGKDSEWASGEIRTYGDITVIKKWVTDDANHPDAKVVLYYNENGTQKQAWRTLKGDNGRSKFTIHDSMTDCHLEEDMSGLDGYTSTLQVSQDGKTYTFINTKDRKVKFSKRAVSGSEELPGASLKLYRTENGTETEVESWKSTDTPHEITLKPGEYRLHETVAPGGYAMSQDIRFTVTANLELQSSTNGAVEDDMIRIYDKPLTVKFIKKDPAGNALQGAVLSLWDKTKNEQGDHWTTDGKPHEIKIQTESGKKLIAGHTYILREESAPDGYELAQDIEFVFNGDGTIPGHGYATVTMTDAKTEKPNPTPTPTPTPGVPTTPSTPSTPGGNSSGRNPIPTVKTGDSPRMWVLLAAGVVCLIGSGAAYRHYRAEKRGEGR